MRNRSKVLRATLAAMVAAALLMGAGEVGAAARKSAADSRASVGARAKFAETWSRSVMSLKALLPALLDPRVIDWLSSGDFRIWRMPAILNPPQD